MHSGMLDDNWFDCWIGIKKKAVRSNVVCNYMERYTRSIKPKYVYKKNYPNGVGCSLRTAYENGAIKSEKDFKEVLNHVLLDCKEI